MPTPHLPAVVLVCHAEDLLDREGLASWLASTMRLAGLLIIRDEPRRRWRAARREIRRVGALRFLDVVAFRLYARLRLAAKDEAWKRDATARLRRLYPADLERVPRLVVSTPNSEEARAFIAGLQPDIVIARCKVILTRTIFELPRVGTFVLHPGICPEYRNAHGCFWALVNRDLTRVGMTLLRVDPGIDTGPVYLHATCDYDEITDSHTVIQYRAVIDNLEAIGSTLIALHQGKDVRPVPTAGRRSAEWGQPQLTKYLRWKWAAGRLRRSTTAGAVPSEAEGRSSTALGAGRTRPGRTIDGAAPAAARTKTVWAGSHPSTMLRAPRAAVEGRLSTAPADPAQRASEVVH